MSGLGAKEILRNVTALEQLIEEINFQRAKEMRQCLMSNSDSGFMMVHGTTYWTDLFVRHFLFQTDRSTDADDLLFFIRKKQLKGSRYIPKYQTEVEVYRKDSRKLPIGDPDIDWEETVYVNLIIHQFDYTLTLAVCTRTSPKDLQVLRRHSQKVYASPSRRRMDTKGEVEEMTYPNVCFHVDNFDEIFADMLVRDGEMICVELLASDHSGSRQAVIFLGSIRYDALKRVYDARASMSSKVAQRMMLNLFSGTGSQRIEFVRMKGPQGKGHAEMAVTKPKGSGVETPTSEPGICLTDAWGDSDWEDEPEERFNYRHQRRLSDPSANFNTFINSGWKTRATEGSRSRSENEGLDSFNEGLYEIESGDLRDAMCSGKCCPTVTCHTIHEEDETVAGETSCGKCTHFHGRMSPSTAESLSKLEAKGEPSSSVGGQKELLNYAEEKPTCSAKGEGDSMGAISMGGKGRHFSSSELMEEPSSSLGTPEEFLKKNPAFSSPIESEGEYFSAVESQGEDTAISMSLENVVKEIIGTESNCYLGGMRNQYDTLDSEVEVVIGKNCTLTEENEDSLEEPGSQILLQDTGISHEFELVTETSIKNTFVKEEASCSSIIQASRSFGLFSKKKPGIAKRISTVTFECENFEMSGDRCDLGSEKLSVIELSTQSSQGNNELKNPEINKVTHSQKGLTKRAPLQKAGKSASMDSCQDMQQEGNVDGTAVQASAAVAALALSPGKKRVKVPCLVLPDGSKVHFHCDAKLDDGAYNPLWTTRGFTQTFHFWKESKRAQSTPLNAYLTYIALPWFTIITDILDHRTGPILTF